MLLRINFGGEGEEAGHINQQPPWCTLAAMVARGGASLQQLVIAGMPLLVCDNTDLPLPDQSVDAAVTNGTPIDISTWLGPGVQSSEIKRVLKSGCPWTDNGIVVFTKP